MLLTIRDGSAPINLGRNRSGCWVVSTYCKSVLFMNTNYFNTGNNTIFYSKFDINYLMHSQRYEKNIKKFHLTSKLNQIFNTSIVDEKIMNITIELFISQVLAVVLEIAGYIHNRTQKLRLLTPKPSHKANRLRCHVS